MNHGHCFWSFQDNLTRLAPMYLKLIKQPGLEVHLPQTSWMQAQKTYLKYKARVIRFAGAFGGNDHSLRAIRIHFAKYFHQRSPGSNDAALPPGYVQTCHNILEPLETVYGVKDTALVESIAMESATRLTTAMTGQKIVYANRRGYGTRVLRANKVKIRKSGNDTNSEGVTTRRTCS